MYKELCYTILHSIASETEIFTSDDSVCYQGQEDLNMGIGTMIWIFILVLTPIF